MNVFWGEIEKGTWKNAKENRFCLHCWKLCTWKSCSDEINEVGWLLEILSSDLFEYRGLYALFCG